MNKIDSYLSQFLNLNLLLMKTKIIFFLLLFTACFFAKAQLTITCDTYEEQFFDPEAKEWKLIKKNEIPTVFKLNADMTTFIYIQNNETQNLTIKTWEYDEKGIFDIVLSDNKNNSFDVVIDGMGSFLAIKMEVDKVKVAMVFNIVDSKYEPVK